MCSAALQLPRYQVNVATEARRDPTHTTTLRNRYAADMRKRFTRLRGQIWDAVVVQDVFGIAGGHDGQRAADPQALVSLQALQSGLPRRAFMFPRSDQKVTAFLQWIRGQVDQGILQFGQRQQLGYAVDSRWQDVYLEDSYKRGVIRSTYEMKKAGFDLPDIEARGGIGMIMGTPMHVDRLGLIYSRAFNELKGVTDAMDQHISRVLAQGLADGDGPRTLARKMNAVISGANAGTLGLTDTLGRFIPAQRRAEMLARTEVIRAHHSGMMQEYRNWGVEGLNVQAEFRTAGDSRVCEECAGLEGQVFTLDEAENLIPVHPMCRCIVLPAVVEDKVITNDLVAAGMNEEYREEYLEYRKQYDEAFANVPQELLDKISNAAYIGRDTQREWAEHLYRLRIDWDRGYDALQQWQGSTQDFDPMALKYWAAKIEGQRVGNQIFPNRWTPDKINDFMTRMASGNERIRAQDYLRIRAWNQAYMARVGIKEERLYRGIGGSAGRNMRDQLTADVRRTNFTLPEAPLSGFSSDKGLADSFGADGGGITITDKFTRDQIVVHRNMFSWLTGSFMSENEFIILGGKRRINVVNINYGQRR